ncbi:MAG: HAMP domain-containing sensor histidine kinase [Gemmatimonadota bacterium]
MRPFPNLPRGPFRGATALGVFLLATLALAGWLGYQALDAAASHRRTAEAVLRDYAGIAAVELARVGRSNLDDVLDDVFDPISRRVRVGNRVPLERIALEMDDAMDEERCPCPGFRSPLAVFTLDPGGILSTRPDTLAPETRTLIVQTMRTLQPPSGRSATGILITATPSAQDRPLAIGYVVSEDAPGIADPTFGFLIRAEALGELFEDWYEGRRLLPQPIAGDQPSDSILFVTVETATGAPVFASPTAYPTELSATSDLGPEYGGLVVRSAIRPDAASQLIIGGLPNSRLPLLAALLLLTLGIGIAAVIQLRQEQSFQTLREDFVSGVSHELRTPLAQIRMFAELQEAGKLRKPEDQARAISVIHREARRLSHLVENILQFSRLRRTAGRVLPRERLDFAEALEDGLDAVTPLLEERGDRLIVTAPRGLSVHGNRDAITRIVVNLLDNAVKYGPAGQTVRVGIDRVDGAARLTVSDQGPGVPPGDREQVWKPYRRLERDVKARLPGTGIGLSVVSELASLHEGRAWVEDAEGGGARFVVELPLAPAEASPIDATPAPALRVPAGGRA